MEEMIITNEMRQRINEYLGYELIKEGEIGHNLYDEAPGLGKIGIECTEFGHVVTTKQLDSNGNVEWFKNGHPKARPGEIKSFHCKLTTISAKKAKVLIASLFPEEAIDEIFLRENNDAIEGLRKQLHVIKQKGLKAGKESRNKPAGLLMGPNEMFLGGVSYMYSRDEEEDKPAMLYGPNDMPL